MSDKPRYRSKTFNYRLDFKSINFREHPELYQIGRGEQGVLTVEPYKSEILPYWKFKTLKLATTSAKKIYKLFLEYKATDDFVGMDMARKYLQMGYTRSRRYANHKSGKKYVSNPQKATSKTSEEQLRKQVLPQETDALTNEKAQSASIFYKYYIKAKEDKKYKQMKHKFLKTFDPSPDETA